MAHGIQSPTTSMCVIIYVICSNTVIVSFNENHLKLNDAQVVRGKKSNHKGTTGKSCVPIWLSMASGNPIM